MLVDEAIYFQKNVLIARKSFLILFFAAVHCFSQFWIGLFCDCCCVEELNTFVHLTFHSFHLLDKDAILECSKSANQLSIGCLAAARTLEH